MKRLAVDLLIVIASLAVIDVVVGRAMDCAVLTMPSAGTLNADQHDALVTAVADVVVLGSSRARHHYDPSLLASLPGCETCYNSGCDGHGMNYSMVALEAMVERHTPRVVILDVSNAQLDDEWVKNNAIDDIQAYYSLVPAVTRYYDEIAGDCMKRLKLRSNLYRHNGDITWVSKAFLSGAATDDHGFDALAGSADGPLESRAFDTFAVDSLQLRCLDRVVALCRDRGILPVIVISPNYEVCPQFNKWMSDYCSRHSLPLFDYTDVHFDEVLYHDASHLNSDGAERFSRHLADSITVLMHVATP